MQDKKSVFECLGGKCPKTCCGPFKGISDELLPLDSRPFSEIVLTDEDAILLIDKGYSHYIEQCFSSINNKQYYRMIIEPNGNCIAYENGKCSIHEINPTLCKAFPFYFDIFAGLCVIKCAGIDVTNTDISNCGSYIEATRKMYLFWLDFYKEI